MRRITSPRNCIKAMFPYNMLNIPSHRSDPVCYRMPALITHYDSRSNSLQTQVSNLQDVAQALRVETCYILKYWEYELGVSTVESEMGERYTLSGHFPAAVLQAKLDQFIEKFVLCDRCKYPDIKLVGKKGRLCSKCTACGASLVIESHPLTSFILRSIMSSPQHD